METYEFSGRFQIGSLQVTPVHLRVEQLQPVIAEHRHANFSYEIHYTARGHGTAIIDGQAYEVLPGSIYVTGPGVLHEQHSDIVDPVLEYCLYLNCRQIVRLPADPLAHFVETPLWKGVDDGTIAQLLQALLGEQRNPQADLWEMSQSLMGQLLIVLTRMYRRDKATVSHSVSAPALTRAGLMPIIEDAFFYRYASLTLEELANLLGLSTRQTQRVLKQAFGKTYTQKLSDARMAAASQFLIQTDQSITEIAEKTGFSSIEHFSSTFHRFMGCSPREYRKQHRAWT